MLFMIIERFQDNDMLPIYQRVASEGRMFPEGLEYIDSWVEPSRMDFKVAWFGSDF